MSYKTCIAINQTAGDIILENFGSIVIPSGGQYELSDDTHFYEIKASEELSGYVADGSLLINDGIGTLNKEYSLNYITPWYSPYDAPGAVETVASTSADWNSAYSTVESNSATIWDSSTDISALSSAIDDNETDINSLSGYIDDNTNRLSGYVDLTSDQIIGGNKTFNGNMRVDGVFTATSSVFIETENLGVSANFITLNTNITGAPTEDAGIRVNRGTSTDSELRWNETEDRWEFGISGNLEPIASGTDIDTLSSAIDTNTTNIAINAGDISNISAASGSWNNTTSTVSTNSANWQSTYTTVSANSGDWSSAQIPVQATPPTSPSDGDQWIKSPEMMLYVYSSTYGGWIGDQIMEFTASRNSSRAKNIYLRNNDGMPTNIGPEVITQDAIIIGMGMSSKTTETWTLEVRKNGSATAIDSLVQTATTQAYSMSKSSTITAGDRLHLYCNSTSRIDHPRGKIYYRWFISD